MPVHQRPFEKGNLYIRFNVVFPTTISPAERSQLASILPGGRPSNGMEVDDAEHVRTPPPPGLPSQHALPACRSLQPTAPECAQHLSASARAGTRTLASLAACRGGARVQQDSSRFSTRP